MVRLGSYDGLLREVIHEIKFTRWRKVGDQMGRRLGESLGAAMGSVGLDAARTALVPVPTSFWRRMARGVDHALVICRGMSAVTDLPILPLLWRSHRPSQTAVVASERAANVAGSIRARRSVDLAGWTLVVVDDVTTTRATLNASCRALREAVPAGAQAPRLWTAVLAVTPSGVPRRPAQASPSGPD
jgi:predicted amidophosphoribosyltransferase